MFQNLKERRMPINVNHVGTFFERKIERIHQRKNDKYDSWEASAKHNF